MIELLKIVFLGIVEGITEWLPISSTGHMILVDEFLKLDATDAFKEVFFVVIQLGAILAVVVLYFDKLNPFEKKPLVPTKKGAKKTAGQKTQLVVNKETIQLWGKVLIASLPAAIIGLPLDDWLDEKLYNYPTVALMLILYGVLFIVVENYFEGKKSKINRLEKLGLREILIIGAFQVLALIPGTSRSGATILGGILAGASRKVSAEFTFFLAIPVMLGASLLKLVKYGAAFSVTELSYLIVGMVTAFFVSILAIKFLLGYIKKHSFKAFGYYRITLGLLVFTYFFLAR